MQIKILDRFRPFSHKAGTKIPVPFTRFGVEIYPAAFRLLPGLELIPLKIEGKVEDFTAMLDLEKGVIKVFGKGKQGFFSYQIFGKEGKVCFSQDRGSVSLLDSHPSLILSDEAPLKRPFERLSLGVSKKLDFEQVIRRNNLLEWLPVWFTLGQMVPKVDFKEGDSLFQNFLKTSRNDFEDAAKALFETGFSGILYPQSEDPLHLGYCLAPLPKGSDPRALLSEGYQKIRSLFALEKENSLDIFPGMPSFFKSGKIALQLSFGALHIDWTKGFLRRMVLSVNRDHSLELLFPNQVKSYRVITSKGEKLQNTKRLDLRAGTNYFFDHFLE